MKSIYQPALDHPEIIGIVVGTRPECVDDEKLDYFRKLSEDHYVVIEYGIESVFDRTLERVNRGHNFEATRRAIEATAERGIRTGGHIILGLPGEIKEDWISSAAILSELPLSGIKFHQLQLIKGTAMAMDYKKHPEDFVRFELNEYLEIAADIIERLNPEFIVERVAGEVSPSLSLMPGWGIRYDEVLRRFEHVLDQRDTWQGRLYQGKR